MNRLFEQIGSIITSMGAVISVLLLTLLGLITFTHTLFNEVLPGTLTGWERAWACWLLALGWEATLLITTCNTQFLNRRIPAIAAIASGIIVLFFIQAFDPDQSLLEFSKKFFIGALISSINYIYTELFYAKWQEIHQKRDQLKKISEVESALLTKENTLTNTQQILAKANLDIERLTDYVVELECFKQREIEKLTCPFCKTIHETIFKLNSHKGICDQNPKKNQKLTIYERLKD